MYIQALIPHKPIKLYSKLHMCVWIMLLLYAGEGVIEL